MKMEIDLDDLFRDENGVPEETLQESIRRQITDRLAADLRKKLFDRLDAKLSTIMEEQIGKVMQERMPDLIDDIMNVTYTPVSTWGQKGTPTTFREEIVKALTENLKYQPRTYASEENAFTKAVKSIVESKTEAIRKEIVSQVDKQFAADALRFAVEKLSERLGLPKVQR